MIIIEVKQSTKCFEDFSLYITFNYDINIVNIMRSLPERYWIADKKVWEVPIKYLDRLKKDLASYEVKIIDEQIATENMQSNAEMLTIPLDYKFKTRPYKHQLEGIEYGLNHNNFLLGDEQGLGKTMQVINIACIKKKLYGYKHCLIVCGVNGLKWNWKAEIEKHSDERGFILGTRIDKTGKEKICDMGYRLLDLQNMHNGKLIDSYPYFIITNIETLRNNEITAEIKKLCEAKIIDIIAFDEFHKCKNPTSQQGKAILKLQADNMIAMTGTPLMNSPIDLYMPLKWLNFEHHNFYSFKNHYCIMGGFGGYQIMGYKNLEQLRAIVEEVTLRRLKKDVLDLPDKIYTTEFVEMSPKQAKIYKEVKMEIKENIDMIVSAVNPLAEMIRLRQATGYTGILSSTIQESAKFDRLEELVDEAIENGDKVIVFSNWTDITSEVYKILSKHNPAYITGETKDRVKEQDKFMQDDDCKVIIGTIGAMGTGLTLTASSTVIFLDEPWNRATKEQAEDRAHRIGTTKNVNIITLMCKDTIDERIHELLMKKGAMADMLVDGRIVGDSKEQLVEFLLS